MRAKLVGVLLALALGWAPGQAGLQFDGVDDTASTALALSTFLSAATGSLTVWYKPTGTAGSMSTTNCYQGEYIFGDFDIAGGGGYMGLYRNGNLGGVDRLCAFGWDTNQTSIPVAYTPDAWTHLGWVHTGGNLLFYKDGVLVTSAALGDLGLLTQPLRFGEDAAAGAGDFLDLEGTLAEGRAYAGAIGAAEMANLAGRTYRIGTTTPTGYWPLDECGDGTTVNAVAFVDRSGNGRVMTADDGANNTGATCRGSDLLSYPWGPE